MRTNCLRKIGSLKHSAMKEFDMSGSAKIEVIFGFFWLVKIVIYYSESLKFRVNI